MLLCTCVEDHENGNKVRTHCAEGYRLGSTGMLITCATIQYSISNSFLCMFVAKHCVCVCMCVLTAVHQRTADDRGQDRVHLRQHVRTVQWAEAAKGSESLTANHCLHCGHLFLVSRVFVLL